MPNARLNANSLKRFLLNGCGYSPDLLAERYSYGDGRFVDLAAFAHRPFDARSACIAAFDSRTQDPRQEVMACRSLGAPVVLVNFNDMLQVWRPGRTDATCVERGLTSQQAANFFSTNERYLSPRKIYEAKTIGRVLGGQRQMDMFVDTGLLPYAEKKIGTALVAEVVNAASTLKEAFPGKITIPQQEWIFKSVFRLLAAKILKDKGVPGFIAAKLDDVYDTLQRVQKHYGSKELVEIGQTRQQKALEATGDIFKRMGNLRNLTTEALADVYEQALITAETRKLHGTHATPSYLVDYVVWQLAHWIKKIPPEHLNVFEPACGHAPFLIGMMRLLRNLQVNPDSGSLSMFLRERLRGIEKDSFALEIARLSLTVADEPNPNGWAGLKSGDMFAGRGLEDAAQKCTVFLSNPPFEDGKPFQMLERAFKQLPASAVFGVVLPSTLLFGENVNREKIIEFRKWLVSNCELAEVSMFPDGLFTFADQEVTLLLGRRFPARRLPPVRVRCRRVREDDKEPFKQDYRFTSDRVFPQAAFSERDGYALWVPELEEEVWSWLRQRPKLESIAEVGQGLQHKAKKKVKGIRVVSEKPFRGGQPGYAFSRGDWALHSHPEVSYISLSKKAIRRPLLGTSPGKPQVLAPRNPVRDIWRLKAFMDKEGHPFLSSFFAVRPRDITMHPLEYILALCWSPVASAYIYTHSLKRNIQDGDLRQLPVPHNDEVGIRQVVKAVRAYRASAARFDSQPPEGDLDFEKRSGLRITIETLHELLKQVDAQVLRLYDLPARAERKLLEQFSEKPRLGVPGSFTGYFPPGFAANIPLYAYLSHTYQDIQSGRSVGMAEDRERRYEQLNERSVTEALRPDEEDELYALQAEVDGRDYALQPPDDSWLESVESAQGKEERELGSLANRLADVIGTSNSKP